MGYSVRSSSWRLFKIYCAAARKRKLAFRLSFKNFLRITQEDCIYCGRKPEQKTRSYTYNGIDRMNNNRGYVNNNVVACCKECNSMKSSYFSFKEFILIRNYLKEIRGQKTP